VTLSHLRSWSRSSAWTHTGTRSLSNLGTRAGNLSTRASDLGTRTGKRTCSLRRWVDGGGRRRSHAVQLTTLKL